MTRSRPPLTLALAVLAGCSASKPNADPAPAPRIQLASTLTSPTDVALEWRDTSPEPAGRVVEFATDPAGQYNALEFLAPSRNTFTHPDVAPETTCYYRVRPFYGPASSWVDVAMPEPPAGENIDEDDHTWAYPRTVAAAAGIERQPIRGAASPAAGAPTNLRAMVMHSSGIWFTWTDHASDEDGYLLEVRPEGSAEFNVVAVLDPDINSYGLITLPAEKRAAFRVRAFYYGPASNLVRQTTGNDHKTE